jgi:hypothetical protein
MNNFYFGILHPVAHTLSRLLKNRLSQQLFKVFIYTYILPLHVSALAGHLQAEHTMWKNISMNKHLEQLLQEMVLPITLINMYKFLQPLILLLWKRVFRTLWCLFHHALKNQRDSVQNTDHYFNTLLPPWS